MSDVMKYAQIKNENGTITATIPIGVDASNVDMDANGRKLSDIINEYVEFIDLAPTFNQNTRYEIGDYVVNNNKLYIIKSTHSAGTSWSQTSYQEIKLGDELKNFIKVSNTQPSGSGNRVWIDSSASSSLEIPTYNEMITMRDAITAEIAALKKTIAPSFLSNSVYEKGTYVYYEDQLYRITAKHTSGTTWSNTSKEKVTISNILQSLV